MARSGATVVNQADGSGVGDMRWSMLTEAEFQAQNGTNWVLMDGRNVAGSKYAILKGVSTIPDHRGLSPRAKNNGRSDGNQDPGGERALGNFQDHAFNSHNHGGATGSHTHWAGERPITDGGAVDIQNGTSSIVFKRAGGSGGATASISSDGGAETRMRNMASNCFIKIN